MSGATRKKAPLQFMALLARSPDIGDGWRQVSGLLWPFALKSAEEAAELFEVDEAANRIRLTPDGAKVWEYRP